MLGTVHAQLSQLVLFRVACLFTEVGRHAAMLPIPATKNNNVARCNTQAACWRRLSAFIQLIVFCEEQSVVIR